MDVVVKVDGENKKVIAPGLKLRSKEDGTLYTVDAIGKDTAVLRDPNGNTLHVSDADMQKGYDLD